MLIFRLLGLLMTNPSGNAFVGLQTVYDLTLVVDYRNDINEEENYL